MTVDEYGSLLDSRWMSTDAKRNGKKRPKSEKYLTFIMNWTWTFECFL